MKSKDPLNVPTTESRTSLPTSALLREALDEAKTLAQLEIELAKDELRRELVDAKKTAFAVSAATMLLLEGCTLVLLALALTLGLGAHAALLLGVVLIGAGGAAAYFGWRKAPHGALPETQRRLRTDVQVLKEHVA
jgi:protein-S-isoprenylcysteine O-methyltransferase Ste14